MENKQKDNSPGSHAIRTFLFVLAALLLYAYGADVTQINLEENNLDDASYSEDEEALVLEKLRDLGYIA